MSEIIPVILAAGRGKRLESDELPKPMVPVAERPLMQTAVESLLKIGFSPSQIKAVVGYKGEVIQSYFGADVDYVFQKELTGNAGALELAFSETEGAQDRHILAIQGDDADQATVENLQQLIRFHMSRNADISILTVDKPDPESHRVEYVYGSDGRVIDMTPIQSVDSNGRYTAGIYIFSGLFLKNFLPVLKEKTPDGNELGISKLIRLAVESGQRVFQLSSNKDYISVNTPEGLDQLRKRGPD